MMDLSSGSEISSSSITTGCLSSSAKSVGLHRIEQTALTSAKQVLEASQTRRRDVERIATVPTTMDSSLKSLLEARQSRRTSPSSAVVSSSQPADS